ncbi:DUF6074 family protein [Rhizobiaceae bacterium n13]|uniref:DUF6074 family protein n=1 Tax=Ferirhizobium litorale TaxID=2927786 RepID=A0AAE3U0W8_9HYPH|nr:DUF6074 family protein [Fererhizobium litorale]MDI7861898.1 DUF6074 family protein [Fererhizobium litorale]MDI7921761.1 DUF6074 family protein [Fererhizobium litorale]
MTSNFNAGASAPIERRVVPFPLARRQSLICSCATVLDSKHGREATDYWRGECRKLADELSMLGFDELEVRRQVLAFQDAVQFELMRLTDARNPVNGREFS